MAFQWLEMRISEEKDRREREAQVVKLLPVALAELYIDLEVCVRAYTGTFGPEAAEIQFEEDQLRVIARDQKDGQWLETASAVVSLVFKPEGFRVERTGKDSLLIEIGLLPTGKLYYRDEEQYLTVEEMTRRILDRTLFPKLPE